MRITDVWTGSNGEHSCRVSANAVGGATILEGGGYTVASDTRGAVRVVVKGMKGQDPWYDKLTGRTVENVG